MKAFLKIILLILLTKTTTAQNSFGTVMGKIKDKETGSLLPFASFCLLQDTVIKYKTETDFDGNYKIKEVKPGTYTVKVIVTDHDQKEIKGFLVKGHIINFIDVELNKTVVTEPKKIRKRRRK